MRSVTSQARSMMKMQSEELVEFSAVVEVKADALPLTPGPILQQS